MSNMAHRNRRKEDVVHEGWLMKRGEHIRNWRPRYFILYKDGALLGFKGKADTSRPLPEPLNDFNVREAQIIVYDTPKANIFVLRCLQWTTVIERTFSLEKIEERTKWCKIINELSEKLSKGKQEINDNAEDRMSIQDDEASIAAFNAILGHPVVQENGISVPCHQPTISVAEAAAAAQRDNITMDGFDYLKVLGKGTFGKVILCKEKKSNLPFAIKVIRKDVIIRRSEVTHTMTENRILQRCKHPFLTELKYSFQTRDYLCFVMEFAIGGDLYYHLSAEVAKRRKGFTEERVRFYGSEILLALGYLHASNIVYRDLKLENVLIDRDGHVKIADFGLCKEDINFGDTTNTFCGTPEYIAPEVLMDSDYGRAVDWWSFGIVMYEMVCGRLPFMANDPQELFHQITSSSIRYPPSLSENTKALLTGLLRKEPSWRLGGGPEDAVEICNHIFFNGMDWSKLFLKQYEPPFRPDLSSETDTRYFDKEFTTAPVQLTPPSSTSVSSNDENDETAGQAHFVQYPMHNSSSVLLQGFSDSMEA